MTTIRLSILALLTVLAVCAATAASASASEFLIEGKQVTEATNVEGTSGLSLVKTTVAGVKVEIECPEDTMTGKIEAAGRSSATLVLKKCKETKPLHCSVAETLESKLNDKLIGSAPPEDEFEPLTPEGNFFEITITGAECAIKGTYKVTGTQACELPKAEEETAEHEIACKEAGSKLKLVGVAVTFSSTDKVKLTSGKKWSVVGMQPPRPEKVDFKGNQALLIDHRSKTAYGGLESALAINEYGAGNEVEWESEKAGEVKKTWPPVYVLGKAIKLEALFAVDAATREFLETKVEGLPEITGETTVASGSFSFTRKITLTEIKTQLAAHAGYLTTNEIEASAALVKKVAKSIATITWKWTLKQIGREPAIKQELGTSVHTFYLIYKAPLSGTKIYFTLLDLDTLEIEKEGEPFSESKVISGAWAGFSNKQKEAGCVTLECPILRIRTYNPANAEITRDGNPLLYYEHVQTGLNLSEYIKPAVLDTPPVGRFTVPLLLKGLTGECGAWARAFKKALATEGVASLQLRIFPKYPSTPAGLLCQVEGACAFLVKTWSFSGGTGLLTLFPYKETETTDQNGTTGQGVENPNSAFNNHQLIEVGNKLYDPSYGTAPVGAGNAGEVAMNLTLYQEKNISGFCLFHSTEFNCSSTVTGLQRLGSTVQAGSESEEETEGTQQIEEL